MKSLLFLTILISLSAQAHKKHSHREHGAHKHGAGSLGIAFEGAQGKIDFKIPSESIFGFEHEAKTEKDKSAVNDGLAKLDSKFSEMLVFDAALKCVITKDKIAVVAEKNSDKKTHKHAEHSAHSDVLASYNVVCEKSPLGTELIFNFQQQFPKIKDLDVQVIVDNVQKSVKANKSNTKLALK